MPLYRRAVCQRVIGSRTGLASPDTIPMIPGFSPSSWSRWWVDEWAQVRGIDLWLRAARCHLVRSRQERCIYAICKMGDLRAAMATMTLCCSPSKARTWSFHSCPNEKHHGRTATTSTIDRWLHYWRQHSSVTNATQCFYAKSQERYRSRPLEFVY